MFFLNPQSLWISSPAKVRRIVGDNEAPAEIPVAYILRTLLRSLHDTDKSYVATGASCANDPSIVRGRWE